MTIVLTLSPEMEAKLRESAASRDAETLRRLLEEAMAPSLDAAVEALLRDPSSGLARPADGLTDAEFDALVDELVTMTPVLPPLPDEAITREHIYADHP
jgi:hypothetical protein